MREGLGADRYPEFVEFLKTMTFNSQVFGHYAFAAVQLAPSPNKPLAFFMALNSVLWESPPFIYVDTTKYGGQGCYNPGEAGVQLDERLVQSFVEDLKNPGKKSIQTLKKAVQMLLLHEMLHWLDHENGGNYQHLRDREKDLIYLFEKRAYGKEQATLAAILIELWERKRR
ncbi:MAG: hypothetical protein JNL98_26675 [Bryobacterales bacterium]|nr:hypothetical protein [Bryobacterales bacterium]